MTPYDCRVTADRYSPTIPVFRLGRAACSSPARARDYPGTSKAEGAYFRASALTNFMRECHLALLTFEVHPFPRDLDGLFVSFLCVAVLSHALSQMLQDAVQEELLLAQRQAEQERAAGQAQQQVNVEDLRLARCGR